MSLLWPAAALRGQKIIIAYVLYLLISTFIYAFAYHDFVPSKILFWPTLILSAALTTVITARLIQGVMNKTWVRTKELEKKKYGGKFTNYFLLPISIFFLIWFNFHHHIPRALTSITGDAKVITGMGMAQINYGKGRICRFSIKTSTMKSFAFKICINSIFYEHSPKKEFPIEFHLKESFLGALVTNIKRIQTQAE